MKARILVVLLALMALVVAVVRPGRGPERVEVGVTSELFGRWTALGPRHADRYLEIRTSELRFGQGLDGAVSHRLLGVFQEANRDGPPFYVLVYEVADGSGSLPVELRVQVTGDRLRIPSMKDTSWKRVP